MYSNGISTLFKELDRVASGLHRFGGVMHDNPDYPAVNLYAGQERAVVSATLPGADHDDFELSLHDDVLVIKGAARNGEESATAAEGQSEESQSHSRPVRDERPAGRFVRRIQLPFRVESATVEARLENGILYVSLPRAEEDKPRRIEIKAS